MTTPLNSRTLSITINRDPRAIYEFASNPQNLPKWAKGLGRSVELVNGKWIAETPQGPVTIRFVRKNEFGILDHYVTPAPGVEVFVPMRVVPNGSGGEVIFTLFQLPRISDEKYAEDVRLVEQDLKNLKRILEE